MAAPAQQEKPSAEVIGQAFAEQYYTVLHQSPALVYRFYQENSKLGRPEDGANMGLTTGMEAINAKIQSYGTLKAEITSIDAQESYNGGVVVLITGHMVKEDDKRQGFTQTFFLAPQEVGYFVLNDIFRYLEDGHSQWETEDLANGMAALNTSDQETSPVLHNEIVSQPEEANGGEVYDPSEDGEGSVVEQEEPEPVAEVVNEVPTESEEVVEFEIKTEEAPKKTYASIVKVLRESGTQIPAPASRKSTPKVQQHQQVSASPPPAPVSENTISNSNVVEDGSNHEGEGEGFSIYVKNLPLNATPAMLDEAFKKFGPIKSGGIQVRSNKGFCFGFVEFEVLDAAQNAIESGSIVIGGRPVVIEEKKSTSSRGSSRGRFPQGRGGGFRNEGPRGGRGGNYGRGRGYGRGEFGRSDYGNRGNGRGYQNRQYDGYEKGEMGNGGTRVNRGGGPASNNVEKTQRVSATV